MPIDRKTTRSATRTSLSPGLRAHITEAARTIRGVHQTELADVNKADCAGQLFRRALGTARQGPGGSGQGMADIAEELGSLLSDAIRAGTGILERQLAVVTQAWMTPTPETPAPVDAAVPEAKAPDMPPAIPVEVPGVPVPQDEMVRKVLRQFVPMVVSSLKQGGDGYGLAKTVITLFGRLTYDQAAGLGKDKIMQLTRSEPDLWAQVEPIEAKFDKFLDEFTSYDARRP